MNITDEAMIWEGRNIFNKQYDKIKIRCDTTLKELRSVLNDFMNVEEYHDEEHISMIKEMISDWEDIENINNKVLAMRKLELYKDMI